MLVATLLLFCYHFHKMDIKEYISKSDFIVARDCPTKLYYKKMKYPSNLEENEYMKFLAEGGYAVGKLATLLMPGGVEVGREHGFDLAEKETAKLLEQENVIIYEAGIYSENKLVFIDILEKKGKVLNLIEVKSKSTDSSDSKTDSKMKKYYEDVAFQTMVLKETYPDLEVHSFLFLPDKAKRTKIEGLAGWFRRVDVKPRKKGQRENFKVEFKYSDDPEKLRQLQDDGIMALTNVDEKVAEMMPVIMAEAARFVESVRGGYKKIKTDLTTKCFKCEYRASKDDPKDGYCECWGPLADKKPHISELYHAGTIGGGEHIVDLLIKQGRAGLYDLPIESLKKKDGGMGSRGERQLIQIEKTRENSEWFSSDMGEKLDSWEYPLWFIDFETSLSALPFHKDMRPYELVAFQWSCHKLDKPGGELTHEEWINIDEGFPNFRFAESLMDHIGDTGTPLMWATHENTVLRKILEQMDVFNYKNEKLKGWLEQITKDDKKKRPGRLVDMCAFTLKHYFHPQMKGKTSLKNVLPAVWMNNPYIWDIPWFKEYVKHDKNGAILDPYDTLGGDIQELGEDQAVVVRDGTGAMRAYHDMVFGECHDDPAARAAWRDKLLRYCKLDTMSMVIVWKHWKNLGSLSLK